MYSRENIYIFAYIFASINAIVNYKL